MSAVGEKTSSLFGGIGAKFGQLKETPTFKSFEERVGGVYSAARVGGEHCVERGTRTCVILMCGLILYFCVLFKELSSLALMCQMFAITQVGNVN